MNIPSVLKVIPDPIQTLKMDLRLCGIRPNRLKGQNYLISKRIRDQIVDLAKLDEQDSLLEIGSGTGILTWALAARAGEILAVEREESMARLLKTRFVGYPKVSILHDDGLKALKALAAKTEPKPRKIVSNLPYSISSPVLMTLAAFHNLYPRGVLLLQREVVDRVVAKPGDTDRSALSIIVQARFNVSRALTVKSNQFWPVPAVESALLLLESKPYELSVPWEEFVKTVFQLFTHRRKTLQNNLKKIMGPYDSSQLLETVGVGFDVRAQQLTIEQIMKVVEIKYNLEKEK